MPALSKQYQQPQAQNLQPPAKSQGFTKPDLRKAVAQIFKPTATSGMLLIHHFEVT